MTDQEQSAARLMELRQAVQDMEHTPESAAVARKIEASLRALLGLNGPIKVKLPWMGAP